MTRSDARGPLCAAVIITTLLGGCSAGEVNAPPSMDAGQLRDVESTIAGEASACTHVDAVMVDIAPVGAEPQVRIPQPVGWQHSTELDDGSNETVRFGAASTDRRANGRPEARAVVNVVRVPDAGDDNAILEKMRSSLQNKLNSAGLSTELTVTPRSVCGLAGEALAQTGPGGEAIALHVVARQGDGVYVASVTVSRAAGKVGRKRDTELILEGFQVLTKQTAR